MDAECRRHYENLEPLPLDQLKPARSHLSIIEGLYEPFVCRTFTVGMVRVCYPHELTLRQRGASGASLSKAYFHSRKKAKTLEHRARNA